MNTTPFSGELPTSPALDAAPKPSGQDPGGRARGAMPVVILYLVAVVALTLLALREKVPSVYPDEYTYGHLAQSLASGDGFDWYGAPFHLTSALYVYFIAPAWVLASGTGAYTLAKVEGVLALSAVVFPTWWMAREFLGSRLALLPALLSVLGAWTVMGARLMTEDLALPLAVTSMAAVVLCLRRPSTRLAVVALACAGLATWARLQLAALFPAVLASVLLDVALHGRGGWRARATQQRALLAGAGAIVVAGAVLALAAPSVTGSYEGFFHSDRSFGDILRKSGLQLAQFVAISGVVPALVCGAAALRPSTWRDERTRPLVIVFVTGTLAFVLVSGAFLAGFPAATWGIDRYVVYSVPVAFVLMTAVFARRGPGLGLTLLLAAALSLVLLWTPDIVAAGEERALRATVDLVGGVVSGKDSVLLLIAGLAGLAIVAVLARLVRGREAAAVAMVAVVAALLLTQGVSSWRSAHKGSENSRVQLPADREWVDHNSRGDVALFLLGDVPNQTFDLAFFSDRIKRMYVPKGQRLNGRTIASHTCAWTGDPATGRVSLEPGCGPMPRTFLLPESGTRLHFRDETRAVSDRYAGRLVEVSDRPRLSSVMQLPCGPRLRALFLDSNKVRPASEDDACGTSIVANVWPDTAGEVVLRFRGGEAEHAVASQTQQWVIPPRRETSISIPVKAGVDGVSLALDWSTRNGNPELVGAELVEGGERRSMM